MAIFIYERKRLDKWVTDFCNNYTIVNKNNTIYKFSEHNIINGYSFNVEFEKCLNNNNLIISSFNDIEINDIIARCRLLRSLDYKYAVRLLLAAEYSINKFIDKHKPTLFIAPRIDSYILDILERKLSLNKILYLGLWRSAFLQNQLFFTNRGEIKILKNSINKFDTDLFIEKITNNNFKATSLNDSSQFTLKALLKKYFYLYFRDIYLEINRNVGMYKRGYRELTNRFNVPESAPSLSGLLLPFISNKFNLEKLNDNNDKNIFVALQVNPESTIDYYSKNLEFINIEQTLLKLFNTLSPYGYKFFIKDHPNMFGKRDFNFLKKHLQNQDNIILVPYNYSSSFIISKCNFIFTWSGTVSIQAYLTNKIPITICSPYYILNDRFIRLNSFNDINSLHNLLTKAMTTNIDEESKHSLVNQILSTLIPGKAYLHNNVSYNNNDITDLINTFEKLNIL